MTDDDDERTTEQREIDARAAAPAPDARPQVSTDPDATGETDR